MLIVNDLGTDVINLDQAFSFSIGMAHDGMEVLVAYGPGVNCPLAAVGDRPKRALESIVKGHKEGWKIVNLLELLGERPNLTVAKAAIIRPNGQGQ